jgi:hypothetical protein
MAGVLRVPGHAGSLALEVEVARIDLARGPLAVRFIELAPETADLLGRSAARRLAIR